MCPFLIYTLTALVNCLNINVSHTNNIVSLHFPFLGKTVMPDQLLEIKTETGSKVRSMPLLESLNTTMLLCLFVCFRWSSSWNLLVIINNVHVINCILHRDSKVESKLLNRILGSYCPIMHCCSERLDIIKQSISDLVVWGFETEALRLVNVFF